MISQRGDVRIACFDEGTGPAIIILPSLGRGAEDYAALSDLLVRDGFRVVRPQPRGIGGSTGSWSNVSLSDLAEDIAIVLENTGPAVVAGHAYGNFVARMLATLHPELIRGIALLAASAGKTPDGASPYEPDILESVMKSGDLSLSDTQRLKHLRHAFFAPGNDPTPWLSGWYPALKAMQSAALAATPADIWFEAGTAPVLDLQAACDTVAPRHLAHVLRDALGDRVTVKLVHNAGHALVPEQAEEVARILTAWVRGLPIA